MKERPILFSAPMVRAILEGRKTQTRRVMQLQPSITPSLREDSKWGIVAEWPGESEFDGYDCHCSYGKPGDRLWVKEAAWMWCERRPNGTTKTGKPKWHYVPLRSAPIHYCADHPAKPQVDVVSPETGNTWGWRKKLGRFLPKWASRITLEITRIRVERVQDIGYQDAIREGILGEWFNVVKDVSATASFGRLWKSINGPDSWAANPWVWVIEFKVAA